MKALIVLLSLVQVCFGIDVYYASAAAGLNNGTSCGSAYAWTDATNGINTVGKWVAGNTLHLCGAITGSAGGNGIQSQSSGTSGSPITIKFETGAILESQHWGDNPFITVSGAIVIQHNYITVDGGSNGIIRNLVNGSTGATCPGGTCSTKVATVGIYSSGNNTTIKNIQVSQMYVHTADDSGGANVVGVYLTGDNATINASTIRDAYYDIVSIFSSTSSFKITNNTIDHACHFIHIGNKDSSSTGSGYDIHGNTMGPNQTEWTIASKGCTSPTPSSTDSSSLTNTIIYNNTIKSDFCSNWATDSANEACVALIYTTGNYTTLDIFNNLVVATNAGSNYEGFLRFNPVSPTTQSGIKILNNTFVLNNASGSSIADAFLNLSGSISSITAENNIIAHFNNAVDKAYLTTAANFSALSTDNYNNYYDPGTYGKTSGTTYSTFASWQGLGFETNGVVGNPNFDANYKLQVGSSAGGVGLNLTSSCTSILTPLCSDLAGVSRPSTGNWDIGSYESLTTNNLSFSPASLTFGNQTVSTTSSPQSVTVTNNGASGVSFTSVALQTGTQFAISSNTCTGTLAAAGTCTTSVTFTPTSTGAKTDNIIFTDSDTSSPQSIPLSGTGVTSTVSLSPSSVVFPSQMVSTTSAGRTVTMTNTGSVTVNISSIALTTGTQYSIFSNTCGATLAGSANCVVTLTFTPTSIGIKNDTLVFTDDASGSPQSVSLSGTGSTTIGQPQTQDQ